ncbi:MAG: hypothetical protein WDZ36_02960 [Balneolaceae bacterium]
MIEKMFSIDIFDETLSFEEKAMQVFRYQVRHNPVYARFCSVFGYDENRVPEPDRIPLIPVRAFKESKLFTDELPAQLVFRSSGSTGTEQSRHYIVDPGMYRQSLRRGFDRFYSADSIIWAYTPGYQENPDSSLIWMLNDLISRDETGLSRFLDLEEPLDRTGLEEVESVNRPFILFGAAFGLLDLLERGQVPLPEKSIVIETGGMKTYRREMEKEELQVVLAERFGLPAERIHSEYGMCELLSQAYTTGGGLWFESVPWLKATVRDPMNPERICKPGEEGKIGLSDLANLYSCSFFLTEDRGVTDGKGRFKVLGRWNQENLRGCNFLIDE